MSASDSVYAVSGTALMRSSKRGVFYFATAIALSVIVFLGFSPSFYLRAFLAPHMRVPPLSSMLLIVHAVVFSIWMVLLPTQAALIRVGNVQLHRKLGFVAVVWAGLMVILGAAVAITQAQKALAGGLPVGAMERTNINTLSSLVEIAIFGALVAVALLFRRVPPVHRRLMIMSTVSLTQAATGRIAGFFLFPLLPGMGIPGVKLAGVGLSVAFIVALVLHDLLTEQRVHPATVWSALPYLALEAVIFTPFYASPAATALTHWVTGMPPR